MNQAPKFAESQRHIALRLAAAVAAASLPIVQPLVIHDDLHSLLELAKSPERRHDATAVLANTSDRSSSAFREASEAVLRKLNPSALTYAAFPTLHDWLCTDRSLWAWIDGDLDDVAFTAQADALQPRRRLASDLFGLLQRNDGEIPIAEQDVLQSILIGALPADALTAAA